MKTRMRGVTIQCPDPFRNKPWAVKVDIKLDGKRKQSTTFYATQAEAEADSEIAIREVEKLRATHAADVARRKVAKPTPPKPRPGTLADYVEIWLSGKTKLKPSTQVGYREAFARHITPVIGNQQLDELTVESIDTLRAHHVKAGTSSSYVRLLIRILSSCLKYAKLRGKITHNPASGVCAEVGSYDDESVEPNPLSPAQADAFLTWAEATSEFFEYYLWLIRTGTRSGEAAAAKWSLVNFDAGIATVKQTYSKLARRLKPGTDGNVKTKSGKEREIPLSGELVDALRSLRARQLKAALKSGRPAPDYLFVTERGARVTTQFQSMIRDFDRGMAAIGAAAAEHTPHDLRDTFATLHLLADPKRLLWVSATLGHAKITTTLTRYTKLVKTTDTVGYASAFDRTAPAVAKRGRK